jgi:hypothetical protein
MTLRIFFWSNFFGRPWTVVSVLRPLRSTRVVELAQAYRTGWRWSHGWRGETNANIKISLCEVARAKLTLNTDMDVVLGLLCFSCIFIGFGERVCCRTEVSYSHKFGAIRPHRGGKRIFNSIHFPDSNVQYELRQW